MTKRHPLSLASLSVNAQVPSEPVSPDNKDIKISSHQDSKISSDRVQVAFRMNKDSYKELRRMALDEDATVNDLLLEGINLLRSTKGLSSLKG